MKWQWWQQRLTVMVIPEANRQVLCYQLPKALLWGAFVLFALFVTAALGLSAYGLQAAGAKDVLKRQLDRETAKHADVVSDKDWQIESLQQEIIRLSDRAREIRAKLAQLEQLERELTALTGATAASGSAPAESAAGPAGVGGPPQDVTPQDMRELTEATAATLEQSDAVLMKLSKNLAEKKREAEAQREKWNHTPSIWPTVSRMVTSVFGVRRDPFTFRPAFHSGLDIAGDIGDPVYAAADGRVVAAGYDSGKGRYVQIDHGGGLQTLYMHLSEIETSAGASVSKGQPIGRVGSSGRSTGPHLHYEVWRNGRPVNPAVFAVRNRFPGGRI